MCLRAPHCHTRINKPQLHGVYFRCVPTVGNGSWSPTSSPLSPSVTCQKSPVVGDGEGIRFCYKVRGAVFCSCVGGLKFRFVSFHLLHSSVRGGTWRLFTESSHHVQCKSCLSERRRTSTHPPPLFLLISAFLHLFDEPLPIFRSQTRAFFTGMLLSSGDYWSLSTDMNAFMWLL